MLSNIKVYRVMAHSINHTDSYQSQTYQYVCLEDTLIYILLMVKYIQCMIFVVYVLTMARHHPVVKSYFINVCKFFETT